MSSSTSLPQPPSSSADIHRLGTSSRNLFQIPSGGMTLPMQVVVPQRNTLKASIIQFGNNIGFAMPYSYTRERLIIRIRSNLRLLGYQEDGDTYTRERPVRIIFEREEYATDPKGQTQDVVLPERISASIFATTYTMRDFIKENHLQTYINAGGHRLKGDLTRDIREFLEKGGYTPDRRGDYVRTGGITVKGGHALKDLIKVEEYVEFLQNPSPIPITQSDLERLNISLSEVENELLAKRWLTFDDLIKDISDVVKVNSKVVKLSMLLLSLPNQSNAEYYEILNKIGNTQTLHKIQDRLNAVYGYLRAKLQLEPRMYPEFVHQRVRPAPSTVDFETALKEGYKIDPEQFSIAIETLLDYTNISVTQRKYLLDLLEKYPTMYEVMMTYRGSTLTFTKALIQLYYPEKPTRVQELYTFAVNYNLVLPESQEKKQRRELIGALPKTYLDPLYEIYGTLEVEGILDMKQNPLELYLSAISKVQVPELRNLVPGFGMYIPEHLLNREVRVYVLHHISEYRDIITRPQNITPISETIKDQPSRASDLIESLKQYTDLEIINHFGYNGGFGTRGELINNVFQTISEEGFMIFTQLNSERTTNAQTVLRTDIKDIPGPYLVFGTPFAYRVLELEELPGAFRIEKSGQVIFNKIGGNKGERYNIAQVSRLQSLLSAMRNRNPQFSEFTNIIIERIKVGITTNLHRTFQIDKMVKSVKQLPKNFQNLIKEMFYKMFYAGMYMRRWRGPGNHYPLQESQTKGGSDPQPKSIAALGELNELMDKIGKGNQSIEKEIRQLPIVNYVSSAETVTVTADNLFKLIDKSSFGQTCIRGASRKSILSANYYLGVIFGEVIPDFDPYAVDEIS